MGSPKNIPDDKEAIFVCDDCGGFIYYYKPYFDKPKWVCTGCNFEEEDDE